MSNLSSCFVDRLYSLSKEQFSDQVMNKARECFIDYLSVVIGGSKVYSDRNLNYIELNRITGDFHVIGLPSKVDMRTAVMMNAFNAHVLELDDSHRVAMTHLGAPIFSALLGVAELRSSTLKDVLKAAVIGYEAAIRLANTIQPSHKKRGFHVSGTCCTVGCAIGIASLLNYSKQEMENVLSASATSAAGLLAVISGKSEQKPYNIANAAVTGVDAALYGRYYIGAVDILGDNRGFLKAMSDYVNTDRLFEQGYAIEGIYQKLYAACRHCHAPMEAMLIIKKNNKFETRDIKSITVYTYGLAIEGHDHTEITGISSAKQSIPYGVAAACVFQNCGISAFQKSSINDKDIQYLLERTLVIEDKELSAMVPDKRAARVCLELFDGTELSQLVEYAKGEPENPISNKEWQEKFFTLTHSVGLRDIHSNEIFRFVQYSDNEMISELFKMIQL